MSEMSEIDGGPAFPHWDGPGGKCISGLTKREYFAAVALQAIRSRSQMCDYDSDEIAKFAYKDADAMIRAGKGEN